MFDCDRQTLTSFPYAKDTQVFVIASWERWSATLADHASVKLLLG